MYFFHVSAFRRDPTLFVFSQYVTQTVEVESPSTLKQLTKARQRNELLSEKLSNQNERCKQLEEQIRRSDEYSCNLQHKVSGQNLTLHCLHHLKDCVGLAYNKKFTPLLLTKKGKTSET